MSKGFTLVELLAVMVILLIIITILIPTVNDVIEKSRDVTHQTQINKILTATYDYTLKHSEYLPDTSEEKYLSLALLKESGFIESNLMDPKTSKLFNDNLVISIKNVGTNYKYTDKNSKLSGAYLYTVEENKVVDSAKLPKIIINDVGTTSKVNTYIYPINLDDEYMEPSYSAKSYDDIDLTSFVTKIIYHNNSFVDEIETSKSGLYKVNYIVVDAEGNSNTATLNVLVEDTVAPEIVTPGNDTISIDDSSYNYMSGVSCTDNSEICDITYEGAITFHTPGSYVITYTATDPVGNTSKVKRTIRVK